MTTRDIFYVAATICLIVLTVDTIHFGRRVDARLTQASADLHSLVLPTQHAEATIAAASLTFAQVGAKERDAFASQQAYYTKLTSDTDRLLGSANDTLRNFNDVVLPKIAADLDSGNRLLATTDSSMRDLVGNSESTLEAFRPAIANLTAASASAATALADPAIHETLTHLDGVASNLDATASDVHAYVHRITAPVRGTWGIIKELLGLTYQARGAIAR